MITAGKSRPSVRAKVVFPAPALPQMKCSVAMHHDARVHPGQPARVGEVGTTTATYITELLDTISLNES
jgi:hypothetical protein